MLTKIEQRKFKEIDFNNPFFNTLEADYRGFKDWVERKSEKLAFYLEDEGEIQGFLYLKEEDEEDLNITPVFQKKLRLKVGTFKVEGHGTSIGEAFIKIILSRAIFKRYNYEEIYVTIFEKHVGLVNLLKRYGFKYWGYKITNGQKESVYIRKLNYVCGRNEIYYNYPLIKRNTNEKFILSIYPQFHSYMFPESKLLTEKTINLFDTAYTNGIQKVYMCNMGGIESLQVGDKGVIYRPGEREQKGYSSVATSIVTVVEVKKMEDFQTFEEYKNYCIKYSIFNERDLRRFWNTQRYPHIIKMLFNFPLKKRIILNDLRDKVGLDNSYWGFKYITDREFDKILDLGEVNENFIVD